MFHDFFFSFLHAGPQQRCGSEEGHRDRVMSVSFSPDGKTLASASVDGAVTLWNLENQTFSSDLDTLLKLGCDWAGDYLKTNHEVEKSDRSLCNKIPNQN
ncbi:hypothetical protein [Moorena sp. SIO4G3]|uniref:WD40 repeat domain-containing protein n=1 Tax=Moorena sp. SIO4G3 TaxID=2607821 RepID=UPI0025CF9275|nr:hypothetical protein [Moorena sp. SIO4G3]